MTDRWQADRATANAVRAEAEQRKAEQVTDFLMGLFEANDPSVARGDTITARELLEQGVQRADALEDQPELQATLFGVTGRVYHSLVAAALRASGNFEEAEATLLAAYETLESQRGRGDRFTQDALRRLADLYDTWDRPNEAARFRARLVESETTG